MAEKEMTAAELSTEFDRLSLHQTLIDFEIANARARDLTERLIHSTAEVGRLRQELAELRHEHELMTESKTFRVAKVIVAVRSIFSR